MAKRTTGAEKRNQEDIKKEIETKIDMSQTGTYREELENELKNTDSNAHASRLLAQEIDRLTKGEDDKKTRPPLVMTDIHTDRPQKCSVKVRVPVKENPRYNFVGKLIGPKGMTLRTLQDQTGCKMAVMGRGSMKEKDKEEELRKEGGKYAHLNEDLHVMVECYAEITEGYSRLSLALAELKKFLTPEQHDSGYGADSGDASVNGSGAPRGRGAYRGGPPEMGSRGGPRGRGNGVAPRGGLLSRGGGPPPPRGAPRGAPAPRGGPAARGALPVRGARSAPATYDPYGSQQVYGAGYETYDDGYGQGYTGQDPYYDYGAGSSAAGYDSGYPGGAGYGEYSDSWSTGGGGGKAAPPSARGAARPQARAHPYGRGASGDY